MTILPSCNPNSEPSQYSPPLETREEGEFTFHADPFRVREALARLGAYGAARGLSPETLGKIEGAAAEALNNAVDHGCAGALPGTAILSLRWRWAGDWLEIEVSDPGSYRPPAASALLPADSAATRGRGSYIMEKLADEVTHGLREGRHFVRLRHRVGPARPEGQVLREIEATFDGMSEDLTNSYEALAALFHLAEWLATAESFGLFVDAALGRLRELVQADAAYLRLRGADGSLDLYGTAGALSPGLLKRLPSGFDCTERRVLAENAEITVEDSSVLSDTDPLRRTGGMAFCGPVFFQHEVLGVLCLERRPSWKGSYFTAGQLGLMRVIADFLGIARKNVVLRNQREEQQRAMRELEIAAEIQRSLLPTSFPPHARFEVFGTSRSALEVGGDYFDVLALDDGGLLFVIADVMGKGLPAAQLAAIFRTAVRARIGLAARPALLLEEVNRQLEPDLGRLEMFITAQLAHLDPAGASLTVAGAGHCPVLRMNRNRHEVEAVSGEGIPLGVMAHAGIEPVTVSLAPDDSLVFFTDGTYEAADGRGTLLELNGMIQYLFPRAADPPRKTCAALLQFLDHYSEGKPPSDDRTLLIAAPRLPAP